METYEQTGKTVGSSFPIAIKLTASEFFEGGSVFDEIRETAQKLERAGADMIELSGNIHGKASTMAGILMMVTLCVSCSKCRTPHGNYCTVFSKLDMTRILAGPTCGLGLAEHGADDLMVTAQKLPQVKAFVRDTSHGKRSCYLDYTEPSQAETLRSLLKNTDIFIEGYLPGSVKKQGFQH